MTLRLQRRRFRFALLQPLRTAAGELRERCGWLLRLDDGQGAVGWGEVAPLQQHQFTACEQALASLPDELPQAQLEAVLRKVPGAVGFGLGAALAELEGVVCAASPQGWLKAPPPALLLPAGEAMLTALAAEEASASGLEGRTFKWKVAAESDPLERQLLEQLLQRLPPTARLRLDANGGWDRSTAQAWMQRLRDDPRLDWLEQPLEVEDLPGLEQLAALGPVALDESLDQQPELRRSWRGWQVRRPALEGDPRLLLRELQAGLPKRMLSTAFETGIARRWLEHLAGLQAQGPTPVAPGLAPGWTPSGALFSNDPEQVWAAAA
ncbi:O-succinylbenzoate-CoA synthase [Synechococcus sp. KORDI-52]|uniref:o-succinylbenzoate synthase n=1 Tax=Synechococcus sp. KORDI-52 TaxID=585425 RepID=UPI0004E09248|nr:o-succinylbenzoate synthase [Synechococcus sp. KORDI-52]AII48297.1 O-succinylbenzoate-CoA synthase [Synechococcus sp. KORDI-52]